MAHLAAMIVAVVVASGLYLMWRQVTRVEAPAHALGDMPSCGFTGKSGMCTDCVECKVWAWSRMAADIDCDPFEDHAPGERCGSCFTCRAATQERTTP